MKKLDVSRIDKYLYELKTDLDLKCKALKLKAEEERSHAFKENHALKDRARRHIESLRLKHEYQSLQTHISDVKRCFDDQLIVIKCGQLEAFDGACKAILKKFESNPHKLILIELYDAVERFELKILKTFRYVRDDYGDSDYVNNCIEILYSVLAQQAQNSIRKTPNPADLQSPLYIEFMNYALLKQFYYSYITVNVSRRVHQMINDDTSYDDVIKAMDHTKQMLLHSCDVLGDKSFHYQTIIEYSWELALFRSARLGAVAIAGEFSRTLTDLDTCHARYSMEDEATQQSSLLVRRERCISALKDTIELMLSKPWNFDLTQPVESASEAATQEAKYVILKYRQRHAEFIATFEKFSAKLHSHIFKDIAQFTRQTEAVMASAAAECPDLLTEALKIKDSVHAYFITEISTHLKDLRMRSNTALITDIDWLEAAPEATAQALNKPKKSPRRSKKTLSSKRTAKTKQRKHAAMQVTSPEPSPIMAPKSSPSALVASEQPQTPKPAEAPIYIKPEPASPPAPNKLTYAEIASRSRLTWEQTPIPSTTLAPVLSVSQADIEVPASPADAPPGKTDSQEVIPEPSTLTVSSDSITQKLDGSDTAAVRPALLSLIVSDALGEEDKVSAIEPLDVPTARTAISDSLEHAVCGAPQAQLPKPIYKSETLDAELENEAPLKSPSTPIAIQSLQPVESSIRTQNGDAMDEIKQVNSSDADSAIPNTSAELPDTPLLDWPQATPPSQESTQSLETNTSANELAAIAAPMIRLLPPEPTPTQQHTKLGKNHNASRRASPRRPGMGLPLIDRTLLNMPPPPSQILKARKKVPLPHTLQMEVQQTSQAPNQHQNLSSPTKSLPLLRRSLSTTPAAPSSVSNQSLPITPRAAVTSSKSPPLISAGPQRAIDYHALSYHAALNAFIEQYPGTEHQQLYLYGLDCLQVHRSDYARMAFEQSLAIALSENDILLQIMSLQSLRESLLQLKTHAEMMLVQGSTDQMVNAAVQQAAINSLTAQMVASDESWNNAYILASSLNPDPARAYELYRTGVQHTQAGEWLRALYDLERGLVWANLSAKTSLLAQLYQALTSTYHVHYLDLQKQGGPYQPSMHCLEKALHYSQNFNYCYQDSPPIELAAQTTAVRCLGSTCELKACHLLAANTHPSLLLSIDARLAYLVNGFSKLSSDMRILEFQKRSNVSQPTPPQETRIRQRLW